MDIIYSQINQYSCVEPKLSSIQELSNGAVFSLLLNQILDIDLQVEIGDNWTLNLKTLQECWNIIEQKFGCKSKPNLLQIAKNGEEQSILEMVTQLFYGIVHSEYSQQFVQLMMNLDQQSQMIIAKMVQEEMQQNDQSKEINQDIVTKFEELELENQKLRQEMIVMKQFEDQEKKKYLVNLDFMQTEIDTHMKALCQQNDELQAIYDQVAVSSIADLGEAFNQKNEEIKNHQLMNQQLRNDLKQEKEVHEEIVNDLRTNLEQNQRKLQHFQKLEKYAEQLKKQLSDTLMEQNKQKESIRLNQKIKEENAEFQQRVIQLQTKLDTMKQQQKTTQRQQNQIEFEMQKIKSENESLTRQLKLREQEIFRLKQEITELEGTLHNRTEQSNLENSSIILQHSINDYEDRKNLSGIFSNKRNLGLELSQLITKSQMLVEDQKIKFDVHTQTDHYLQSQNSDSKSIKSEQMDDDVYDQQLSFWKSKCNDLIHEKTSYEERLASQEKEIKELQCKIEQFFAEQHKYELELQSAKDNIIILIEVNLFIIRKLIKKLLLQKNSKDKQKFMSPSKKKYRPWYKTMKKPNAALKTTKREY